MSLDGILSSLFKLSSSRLSFLRDKIVNRKCSEDISIYCNSWKTVFTVMFYVLSYCKSLKIKENPHSQVAHQHRHTDIWKLAKIWVRIEKTTLFWNCSWNAILDCEYTAQILVHVCQIPVCRTTKKWIIPKQKTFYFPHCIFFSSYGVASFIFQVKDTWHHSSSRAFLYQLIFREEQCKQNLLWRSFHRRFHSLPSLCALSHCPPPVSLSTPQP